MAIDRSFLTAARHRLVTIAALSDSTGCGLYEADVTNVWPAQVAAELQSRFGYGGSGWVSPITHAIGGFGGPGDPDGPYMESSGSWTNVDGGPGWIVRRPTVAGNGASMTFHDVYGTTIDMVTRRGTTFGSLTVEVDGDGGTSHSQANATADVHVETVRSGLDTGPHTVTVTATSGDSRFAGFKAYNTSGIILVNMSVGGGTWVSGSSLKLNQAAEGLSGETTLSTTFTAAGEVDLWMVSLGVNDTTVTTPDWDLISDMQGEVHKRSRTSGYLGGASELLVVGQHNGNHDSETEGNDAPRMAALNRAWADAIGAEWVDFWEIGGYSFAGGVALDYFALGGLDTVHPSPTGHSLNAQKVLAKLV